MTISVIITTKNRSEELQRTLRQLGRMIPQPSEVLVLTDGCDDGTAEMVEQEFPSVGLMKLPESIGSVGARCLLLERARGEIVVSLDDDSYPISKSFFDALPKVFQERPEASVITFPELRDGDTFASSTMTPESRGHYVSAYANCAAAMRRDVYFKLHGFPKFFGHMYEEPDFALQSYAAGFAVWFEPSLVVRHHLSPVQRHLIRRHHSNARNELWSVWMRCPWPWLPVVSAFRVIRQLRHASRQGLVWVVQEPKWWINAVRGIAQCRRNRHPVPWRRYFAWMRLARQPIYSVDELKEAFGS